MKYTSADIHAEIAEMINSTGTDNTRSADMLSELIAALEAAEVREAELQQLREATVRNGMALAKSLEATIAELRARVAHLESLIADIATVAGRDAPDAIDNDGQPYQSQALDSAIRAAAAMAKEEV